MFFEYVIPICGIFFFFNWKFHFEVEVTIFDNAQNFSFFTIYLGNMFYFLSKSIRQRFSCSFSSGKCYIWIRKCKHRGKAAVMTLLRLSTTQEIPLVKLHVLTLWPHILSVQKSNMIHFCCLTLPDPGSLLWQFKMTNIRKMSSSLCSTFSKLFYLL